jgi:hypothetical protein
MMNLHGRPLWVSILLLDMTNFLLPGTVNLVMQRTIDCATGRGHSTWYTWCFNLRLSAAYSVRTMIMSADRDPAWWRSGVILQERLFRRLGHCPQLSHNQHRPTY